MKVLFLIGPYRAETIRDTVLNIRRAEAWAVRLWQSGAAVVCPHLNTALMDGAAEDTVWLEGAKAILRKCDGAAVMPGWQQSSGSQGEIAEAKAARIPLFFLGHPCYPSIPEELKRWLTETSTFAE